MGHFRLVTGLLFALNLSACSSNEEPALLIPAGSNIAIEIEHIHEYVHGHVRSNRDESNFGVAAAELVARECQVTIDLTFDKETGRHFPSDTAMIGCDGIDPQPLAGIVFDANDGKTGLKSLSLGETVYLLVTQPAHLIVTPRQSTTAAGIGPAAASGYSLAAGESFGRAIHAISSQAD